MRIKLRNDFEASFCCDSTILPGAADMVVAVQRVSRMPLRHVRSTNPVMRLDGCFFCILADIREVTYSMSYSSDIFLL